MRERGKKPTIFILTGEIHAGKTTWLKRFTLELEAKGLRSHGFLSEAVGEGGKTVGYDLYDLTKRSSIPYLRDRGERGWERTGRFYFLPAGLERARKAILTPKKESLLIVDEVGPCELEGRGLRTALDRALLKAATACLLVVRESLLQGFLSVLPQDRVRVLEFSEIGEGEEIIDEIRPNRGQTLG
jgi:nucleoside-triphosphatase THEP1